MAKRCGTDQKVEVTNWCTGFFQPTSFAGEYPADVVVELDDLIPLNELLQNLLITRWVGEVETPC